MGTWRMLKIVTQQTCVYAGLEQSKIVNTCIISEIPTMWHTYVLKDKRKDTHLFSRYNDFNDLLFFDIF